MPKIHGPALDRVRAVIAPLDTKENRARYWSRDFPRADAVRDLDRRYRWDLLWTAGGMDAAGLTYDDGLTDTHIDTALRSIVPALTAADAPDDDTTTRDAFGTAGGSADA